MDENKWVLLAFCIPVLVFAAAMAANGIYPFGVKTLVYSDAAHQYYPFLLEFREKLIAGESLFYSRNIGLGSNFWALIAYYCASPLNLLTAVVPQDGMLLLYDILVAVKLGAAGLCCALFLKHVFGRNDGSVAVFGSMYGLCGFASAYYWNIMWLDTFAIFPLVMLGAWALVKEGKVRLYIISLFAALWCNYLMGLYVCIFVLISFFTLCICLRLTRKQMLERLVRIALCSIVAIAMAAVLLLPAWCALTQTTRADAGEGAFWQIQYTLWTVLGGLGVGPIPSWREGPANIYTALPAVILTAVYFLSGKIDLRQKLCTGAVLAVLLLSCWIGGLETLWNMMRRTMMLPARFSFLFSFVLITAACQVLPYVMEGNRKDRLVMTGTALALVAVIMVGRGMKFGILNAAVLMLYGVLFLLTVKKRILPRLLPLVLTLAVIAEMTIPLYRSMGRVHLDDYRTYPEGKQAVEELLAEMDEEEDSLYKVAVLGKDYANYPTMLGYCGVSMFSSTTSADMIQHMFLSGMAASNRGNKYDYPALNSPLNNAMLGIDYVVFDNKANMVNDGYLDVFAEKDSMVACKNRAVLAPGFMADAGLWEPAPRDPDAFVRQNKIFTAVTGIQEQMYTLLPVADTVYENLQVTEIEPGHYECVLENSDTKGALTYTFEMPRDGLLYGYIYCGHDAIGFTANDIPYAVDYNAHIICLGRFARGEEIVLSWKQKEAREKVMVYAAVLEEETFSEGLALLADEQLQVTDFDETSLSGTIVVNRPGNFCTSIPYDDGWTMYVDGVKRQITPYQNAMIALEDLQPGNHSIELHVRPAGFTAGAWISAAAVAAYAVICLFERKRK